MEQRSAIATPALRAAGSLADSGLAAVLGAGACSLASAFGGTEAAERLRSRLVNVLGFPFHRSGVENNLHTLGLSHRIRNLCGPFSPVPKRRPRNGAQNGPLHIGMVGEMTFGGARPLSLIHGFPQEHRFTVFDTGRGGEFGEVPQRANLRLIRRSLGGDYRGLGPKKLAGRREYERQLRALATDINAADLDLLIVANASDEEKNDLATLVDTPCLAGYLMGSEPVFHPKMDFSLYCQPRAGFPVRGHRLYSVFTGRPLPAERCCTEVGLLYEAGQIERAANPSWEEREPLILYHGRLSQLNSPSFLAVLAELLDQDSQVRFAFLGPGQERAAILDFFAVRGLSGQVQDLGFVDKSEYRAGTFHEKIFSFLRRGRLEANPWPVGGGMSRVEAYLAGIPTANLRFPADGGDPRSRDRTTVGLPGLDVPAGTADTHAQFLDICRRCLHDRDFAAQLTAEQYALADRVTDPGDWWGRIIAAYRDWLNGTGWAAGNGRAA